MGKKKTKRFGALRLNPVASLSDHAIASQFDLEDLASDHVGNSVATIIEKVQSASSEDRERGCQLLASLASQPNSMKTLLQENIVKMIGPLFLDTCVEVRVNAVGALRNVCVLGDEPICDRLVGSDILTPLSALLKQYELGWMSDKTPTQITSCCEVLTEALGLLANLCEGSSKAVQIFNKENFLPSLLPFLKVEVLGFPLAIAVARLTHIVSENNPAVTSLLETKDCASTLLALVAENPTGVDAVLLRTFVIGILLNLSKVDLEAHYKDIVRALAQVVEMDCLNLVMTALGGAKKEVEMASPAPSAQSADTWPEVLKLIQAQGITLELLANFCCSEDEWEEMECEESSSDDQDAAGGACEEGVESDLCLPAEIHSAFLECSVLSKILAKTCPIEKPQIEELKKSQAGKNVFDRLTDLQTRALLCLSNVLSAMEASALTQCDPSLTSVWGSVYALAKTAAQESVDENYKWAVSSAMRATLQRLGELDTTQFSSVTEQDVNFLVSFGAQCKNRETQVNIVRSISTLGCVLSVPNPPNPLLARIGSVLLDVACGTEDLLVVSEALDSVFDVFKEDHTDPVVREIGLVGRLKSLQPTYKSRVNSQRRKLGESYSIVMMARSNLSAFIKYKMSHG